MKKIEGSITNPKGFKTKGFFAGVRKQKDDMAIIYSEKSCVVSGVFTKSTTKAAPVVIDMELLEKYNDFRAVVVNSGNANACTGKRGFIDAKKMQSTVAEAYGIKTEEVLISSTGVIGVPLPIELIVKAIKENYDSLSESKEDSLSAAKAIMTTDTFPKYIGVELEIDGKIVNIGGIAKGSGMIHPNMGTMLGYITTDVNIDKVLLDKSLKESTVDSYNMISIDGDTSTNDTVLVMANGMAENEKIVSEDENYKKFSEALHFVNLYLAKAIVLDGEGAGKFLEVKVAGADTKENARKMAKAVTTSSLVKTAFFGEDANWGRIISSIGSTEIDFKLEETSISFKSNGGTISLLDKGTPIDFSEEDAKKILKEEKIEVNITVGSGTETATAYGCDLSYDYVKINADYRT